MLSLNCIGKFRDKHGRIVGYRLVDQSGRVRDVSSRNLKDSIHDGEVYVFNLGLTSDGKLISTAKNISTLGEIVPHEQYVPSKPSYEPGSKVIDFGKAKTAISSRDLIEEFKRAYIRSGSNAYIQVLKYKHVTDDYYELIVGLRKARSLHKDGTIQSIINKVSGVTYGNPVNSNLILFKFGVYTNKPEGTLGKYIILDPYRGDFDSDLIEGIGDTIVTTLAGCTQTSDIHELRTRAVPDVTLDNYRYWLKLHKEFNSPEFRDNMLIIGNNIVFMGPYTQGLKTITIPSPATTVCYNAFDNCQNIEEVWVYSKAMANLVSSIRRNCNLNFSIHLK